MIVSQHTLTGHCAKVMAAKFMGEPSKVVTGSHDRTLKIYDLRIRACECILVVINYRSLAGETRSGSVYLVVQLGPGIGIRPTNGFVPDIADSTWTAYSAIFRNYLLLYTTMRGRRGWGFTSIVRFSSLNRRARINNEHTEIANNKLIKLLNFLFEKYAFRKPYDRLQSQTLSTMQRIFYRVVYQWIVGKIKIKLNNFWNWCSGIFWASWIFFSNKSRALWTK